MYRPRSLLEITRDNSDVTHGNPSLPEGVANLGTAAIHQQAASSTIPLETLQRAFQNIYDTMDSIDQFKVEALANMKQTVNTLGNEVEKSRGYIARAEGAAQARLTAGGSGDDPFKPVA